MSCEHIWIHLGLVYSDGNSIPGSSAKERIYEDRFYCERCLEIKHVCPRIIGDSYYKPLEGSVPK